MQVWNLPLVFKASAGYMNSGAGIEVVSYRAEKETEKASVQLSTNAVVILLAGMKKVITPSGSITIKAGEGFFLKKGNYIMSEKFAVSRHYESLMVFFDDTVASKLSASMHPTIDKTSLPHAELLKLNATAHCHSFALSLRAYLDMQGSKSFLHTLLEIKLQELFWLLIHTEGGEVFHLFLSQLHNRESHAIERLLEEHYKTAVSLEQLAFLGGYSLSTFKRRVEEIFHTSPRKWIQERRLQEALFLLKSSSLNVSEVSMEVGFDNVSHFVKVFKERWGFTPGQAKLSLIP
ncbi:helix-turn-helix transcriptional regulator [Cesiribacter sp. SM1]|uniref:helix-turn-helix transcriptional regulator n=1 Tax=Cesiribacter sp. SM1 TaxID=2861196 RepID=UPI001CD58ACC|nr:AraC family transcriptional regulator [Cesiribacter sp. SM1]